MISINYIKRLDSHLLDTVAEANNLPRRGADELCSEYRERLIKFLTAVQNATPTPSWRLALAAVPAVILHQWAKDRGLPGIQWGESIENYRIRLQQLLTPQEAASKQDEPQESNSMSLQIVEKTIYIVNGREYATKQDALDSVLPTLANFIRAADNAITQQLGHSAKIMLIKALRDATYTVGSDTTMGLRDAKDYIESVIGR